MQAVKSFLRECLRLLWMVFFRPYSFRREVGQFDRQRILWLIARAITTTVVTPFFLTAVTGLLLEAMGVSFAFSESLSSVTFGVMVGVAGGVVFGVVVSVASSVASGVASGVAGGVACSVVVGVVGGVAVGLAGGVVAGVMGGVVVGLASGVVVGVAVGVAFGLALGVVLGVALGVALGVVVGVVLDVAGGAAGGPAGGLAGGLSFLFCYLRLFLLPFEVPTTLIALLRARKWPQQAVHFLHQSLAFWDEAMLLPQPFLTPLLVVAGEQDKKAGREAIFHIATNTFQQRAAVNSLLELGSRDLLRRRTVANIAQLLQSSDWLTRAGTSTATKDLSQRTRRFTEARRRCSRISADVAAALSTTSNYQKLTALNRARRQLDDLRQFAVLGLRGRESRVFGQVAQQWLEAVNAEIDRLTEEERVEERIPNPYVAPRPLRPGDEIFLGRSGVFRFIEEHFLRSDQNVPVVLYGQPRIGKSSLLRHLATRLPTNFLPVYVDMQRVAQVESTGGLLFNLADAIGQELARRGVTGVPAPSLAEYAAEPFIVFGKFLDAAEAAIRAPENRLILALDEFEEIERKLTEGKISRDLMPFLRNMMQHRPGIALLFAGTHNLDEMIEDLWVPYFRSAVPCKVSYLDEPDARTLITNPIPEFGLDYEPEAVELLLRETHCHPCLIQLACSALVDHKNAQKSHHAGVEDARHALDRTLESGEYVFRGMWEWIPIAERALLAELASAEQSTVASLARVLRLPEADAQRTLERLAGTEVIEAAPVGNGAPAYRFQVELFRRWVQRHAARSEVRLTG